MKKLITATFVSPNDAETAIARLKEELNVSTDDISYVYRNDDGELEEIATPTEADEVDDAGEEARSEEVKEGAQEGALVGGSLGALAGIATFLGAIPVIGPVFAAGPIVAALGIGTGALGTTAAGALTGAAAGGLVGALTKWGVSDEKVTEYEEDVNMGNVLLLVHNNNESTVTDILEDAGAMEVDVFESV
ncbi:MAG TPA: hypothetical protein VGE31_00320 [Candidatus Paceibacterota bacterium]